MRIRAVQISKSSLLKTLRLWILLFTLDYIVRLIKNLLVLKKILLVLKYLMIFSHLKIIVLVHYDVHSAFFILFNFSSVKIFLLKFFHKLKFLVYHLVDFFRPDHFNFLDLILRNFPAWLTQCLIFHVLLCITICI